MRKMLKLCAVAFAIVTGAPALACPDGQSEGLFGWCYPNVGGAVGEGFEHLKREGQAEVAGEPLAVWLQQSHDSTERGGTQHIPPAIRQALTGYIDEGLLNQARFTVRDQGAINAAHIIQQWDGHNAGVTLIDIIVFRNVADAYNNPALWAHELTHIKQFNSWGVRDFAISYARDYGAVEREAYAVGDGYAAWAASHPRSPWPQPQPMPQMTYASVCVVPGGGCPLGIAMPISNPCYCPTQFGPVWGWSR